jgi:hypothetical protein
MFLDSFDHYTPTWVGSKYTRVTGGQTVVAGPVQGNGLRFAAPGNWLGPAIRNQSMNNASGLQWTPFSVAWSAHVRLSATGWSGAGELGLLAPSHYMPEFGEPVDFPFHWLTVASDGTLRVRTWAAATGQTTTVLAASAAGAMPLGAWCYLEYQTVIGGPNSASGPTLGNVACRVNGVQVLAASSLVTASARYQQIYCRYFKFGSLDAATAGIDGLGAGAPGVTVDVDDVAERQMDGSNSGVLWTDPVPFRGEHRVAVLFPSGPGAYAQFPVTGAATNWQACADMPPDGDTSYVAKLANVTPLDLYATQPAPAIDEGTPGATLWLWGLSSCSQQFSPYVTQRYRDGLGSERARNTSGNLTYRYYSSPLYVTAGTTYPMVTGLTNARLTGLQIGWGDTTTNDTPATYRGTQIVAELWYAPPYVPPPPTHGRTWVTWFPAPA